MEKKWTSCSTRRRLTVDPDFLDKEIEFQDKSIAHELLHFRYPNQGKMFKQMLNLFLEEGISV